MKNYDFELNFGREYQDTIYCDLWSAAFVFCDGYGAEYNYCIDVDTNYSAIYLMEQEDNGFYETDVDCLTNYEIEWDKEDWAERLEAEMIDFVRKNVWYYV